MRKDSAVSSVVGEMVLIALVLILVPMVTISLINQLPQDRVPTVTIKMGQLDGSTVPLYHKGGDWIRKDDIRIVLNGNSVGFVLQKGVFDLGDAILVPGVHEGGKISFIAKNAVILSEVVR